jgi:hypothetical protein
MKAVFWTFYAETIKVKMPNVVAIIHEVKIRL